MEEIRTDVGRVDSNQETQAKFFKQQLERVEGVANAALDRTTGLQEQVNSVRQQTHDLHESLSGMNRHQEALTTGLTGTMERLQGFQFQIPTLFDDWLKVQTGGYPLTINSRQVEHPWIAPHVPPAPALNLGPIQDSIPSQAGAGPAGHETEQGTSSSSSGPSAGTLFRQYMVSSQENLPLQSRTDGEDDPSSGDAGMEATVVDLVDAEEAEAEAEDMRMEEIEGADGDVGEAEEMRREEIEEADGAVEEAEEMRMEEIEGADGDVREVEEMRREEIEEADGAVGEAEVEEEAEAETEEMKMEDTEGADGPMEYMDETEGDGDAARRVEDGEATHLAVETSEGRDE
jgi:hypothetical protein